MGARTPMPKEKIHGIQAEESQPVKTKLPPVKTGTEPGWVPVYSESKGELRELGKAKVDPNVKNITENLPAYLIKGKSLSLEMPRPKTITGPEEETEKQIVSLSRALGGDKEAQLQRLFYNKKYRRALGINDTEFRTIINSASKGDSWGQGKLNEIFSSLGIQQDYDSDTLSKMAQAASIRGDSKEFNRIIGLVQKAKDQEQKVKEYKEKPERKEAERAAEEKQDIRTEDRALTNKQKLMEFKAVLDARNPNLGEAFQKGISELLDAAEGSPPESAAGVVDSIFKDLNLPDEMKKVAIGIFEEESKIKAKKRIAEEGAATRLSDNDITARLRAMADGDPEAVQEELEDMAKETGISIEKLTRRARTYRKAKTSSELLDEQLAQRKAQALLDLSPKEFKEYILRDPVGIRALDRVLGEQKTPTAEEDASIPFRPITEKGIQLEYDARELAKSYGLTLDGDDIKALHENPEEFMKSLQLLGEANK